VLRHEPRQAQHQPAAEGLALGKSAPGPFLFQSAARGKKTHLKERARR